jgi:methyl coenzyme M reductase alpha subunit|tara:strand:+ start:101 stop:283 length:183 start_codon:yes stop_codon:yes gene_type:complete
MTEKRYRTYSDLSLDELEQVVEDLENMSIVALKQKKKDFRITILKSVEEAKKEIEKRLKK